MVWLYFISVQSVAQVYSTWKKLGKNRSFIFIHFWNKSESFFYLLFLRIVLRTACVQCCPVLSGWGWSCFSPSSYCFRNRLPRTSRDLHRVLFSSPQLLNTFVSLWGQRFWLSFDMSFFRCRLQLFLIDLAPFLSFIFHFFKVEKGCRAQADLEAK